MKNLFSIGSFAIIKNENNQILMAKRKDNNLWNLPGWWVENLESPWNAVIREVKEETWLDIKVEKLIWIYAKNNRNDIVFCFHCSIVWWKLTKTNESSDFWRFWLDNMPENIIRRHKERILNFLNNPENIVLVKS